MMRILGLLLFSLVFFLNSAVPVRADDNERPRRKKSQFKKGPAVRGTGEKRVKEEGQTVIYKSRNKVDFDDSLIEGEVKNPNEFYFTVRPTNPSKNLVERRKNFHKEMLRDTVMIR
ncbi:MAG: hypothetical protein HY074_03345 [Deltaproteobacteria bacterium]|nr:hypothetical protein [Deltaproteobacteria bacterium]